MSLSSHVIIRPTLCTYSPLLNFRIIISVRNQSSNSNPLKFKSEELVATLNSLVQEYDQMVDQTLQGGAHASGLVKERETNEKLKEKIEILQVL